jgi:hypothetical protein
MTDLQHVADSSAAIAVNGHLKKREQSPFASFQVFLGAFAWRRLLLVRWSFEFSSYCFGVKTYSLCFATDPKQKRPSIRQRLLACHAMGARANYLITF